MSFTWLNPFRRPRTRTSRKSFQAQVARPRLEALEKRELLDSKIPGLASAPKIVPQGAPPPAFDHSAFVTGLYYDILQRQPQSSEVAGWNVALNAGASRAQVVAGFLASTEYRTDVVRQDYQTLLGRDADPTGLQAWLQKMRQGVTPQQVITGFLASTEYYQRQGSTLAGWLNGVYRDLLGRAPDSGGLAHWLQALQGGGVSRNAVALAFASSHEENMRLVTSAYQDFLGRPVDGGGASFWVNSLDKGLTLAQLTTALAASPEYLQQQNGTDFAAGTAAASEKALASNQAIRAAAQAQDPAQTVANVADIDRETGDQTEVTVAVDPNNSQRIFVASNENNLNIGMMSAYSTDGGATWTPGVIGTGPLGDGLPPSATDPWATWDEFGNLFFSYLSFDQNGNFSLTIVLSTDGGKTFRTVSNNTPAFDHPEITAAKGLVACTYSSLPSGAIKVILAQVTGLGQVGQFGIDTVPNSTLSNFGDITIGPDGQIMVTFQPASLSIGPGPDQALVSVNPSPLGGGKFTNPTVAAFLNIGVSRFISASPQRALNANLGLAYDRSNGPHRGRVYLIWQDGINTTTNNLNIFVRFSDDNGRSWGQPVQVNDDNSGNSHFFGKVAVDQSTGNVAVAWYDARNDIGSGPGDRDHKPNTDVETFATVSTDGGQSYLPNIQVATGPSNAILNADTFGNDFGDYIGLGYSHGVYYPGWADNSTSLIGNPNRPNFDIAVAHVVGPGATSTTTGGGTTTPPTPFVPRPIDSFDPNETSDEAFSFGVVSPGAQTITGLLISRLPSGLVDNNWWRWQAGQAGTFTVAIDYQSFDGGDLNLRLFTLDGSNHLVQLGSSRLAGVTGQSVTVNVTAGEPVLAWVYGFNHSEASYQMTFTLG